MDRFEKAMKAAVDAVNNGVVESEVEFIRDADEERINVTFRMEVYRPATQIDWGLGYIKDRLEIGGDK